MQSDGWFVSETLPRAEATAQRHLERQGFATFCPRFRKTRRHARRVEQVLAPLFPGYVFVRFDRERDQWRSINGTYGVRSLVGPASSHPQPMPSAAMAALISRCEDGLLQSILATFEPGRVVRLVKGPFADQVATIEQLDDQGRVRVLLDILGGQKSVRVQAGDLAPA